MKKLYICRHGETEWSKSGQHTGLTDIPLTEMGKKEAKLLSKRIKEVPLEAIFTSPLQRAKETACDLEIEIDPDLVEWNYGDYEGKTSEEIHEKNPDWNIFTNGAPNGESIEDVEKRADRFLQKLRKYAGSVAVFSHGHFSRVLAARYLGLKASDGGMFKLSTASLSILGHEHSREAIVLWNDTSHLR